MSSGVNSWLRIDEGNVFSFFYDLDGNSAKSFW